VEEAGKVRLRDKGLPALMGEIEKEGGDWLLVVSKISSILSQIPLDVWGKLWRRSQSGSVA